MREQKKRGENERETPKKSNAGRKSKYHTHIEPYLEAIKAMMRNGATLDILADKFSVNVSTLCDYKNKYPEFSLALNTSGEIADMTIENAFYEMAKSDKWAAYTWLKNRQAKRWRDKQHVFQTGSTVVRKDYEHLTDAELEAEMDQLETIVPGDNESNDEYDTDGELH